MGTENSAHCPSRSRTRASHALPSVGRAPSTSLATGNYRLAARPASVRAPSALPSAGRAVSTPLATPNLRARGLWLALGLAISLSACDGSLLDGPAGPRGTSDIPRCTGDSCESIELPAPESRFPRLSHEQWENTTRDLLRLPERSGLSSTFLGDAEIGVFDNRGGELSVGGTLWGDYQRAAESLAQQVALSPEAVARITPEGLPASGSGRTSGFVRDFLSRAFRRAVSDAEVAAHVALFDRGPEFYPEMSDAYAAGVRLTIEAALQSPHFLYRVELGAGAGTRPGTVRLSGYEIASRLSFALWGTMPDDALFAAAASGALDTEEGVRAEATRLLEDPRAERTLRDFHEQFLQTDTFVNVTRNTDLFPEFSEQLRTSMQEEPLELVRYVVMEQDGSLTDLLTVPYTFADASLARVYGLEGSFDDSFRRVDLDPAQRAGLLTQIGFLAHNAGDLDPDAIHRGVFVNRRILCAPLPAPPMMVPPLPAEDPSMPRTMRQRIDLHTGARTCGASCHGTMINPVGFAYEHYDALGRWRDEDRGLPVDAAATYRFEEGEQSYDGAVDLAATMAEQLQTHRCYAQHWLEYTYGRAPVGTDGRLLRRLAQGSQTGALSVRGMLVELVASEAFRTRSATELEDTMEMAGGGS